MWVYDSLVILVGVVVGVLAALQVRDEWGNDDNG